MEQHYVPRQNRKSEQRARIKLYFISGGAVLLAIGIVYVLLYSPVFRIRAFNITGGEFHSDAEILGILKPLVLNTRFKNFLGPHNLMAWNVPNPDISKTALAEALIQRDWLRQAVDIRVRERARLAIWCDGAGDCDWMDDHGMAVEKAPQTEGSLIITINDDAAGRIIQGSDVVQERFMDNLIAIINGLMDLKLPIKRVTYSEELEEIRVENYSGPELFFSIRFDPTKNFSSLRALMGKTDLSKIRYVDLRVENRLYYK